MKRILVVDDDPGLRLVITKTLESQGYEITQAIDGKDALKSLQETTFDLVITDLSMPNLNGIELISAAQKHEQPPGFIMVTAYGTIDKAVEAMQIGAFDFITKPFSLDQIESRIERYFAMQALQAENQSLRKELKKTKMQSRLIGESKALENVRQLIGMVADSDAPVLITGESGTGKELVAQEICRLSHRADKPFIRFNCAALPENLFESLLFGHEKGAFSGAVKTRKGLFEEGDGGTILLDEISEIPVFLQAKLLRVLQEMKLYRLGNTQEIPIDVRVIATSNQNLDKMVREGKFREDLFFRLNVFPIQLPSLAQRKSDIPMLAAWFLESLCRKYSNAEKTISDKALQLLEQYSWPGNIRQLQHIIERAYLVSGESPAINPEHIWLHLEGSGAAQNPCDDTSELCTLEEMERRMIERALKEANNVKVVAARYLGITDRTLRNKLRQYRLFDDLERKVSGFA